METAKQPPATSFQNPQNNPDPIIFPQPNIFISFTALLLYDFIGLLASFETREYNKIVNVTSKRVVSEGD